MAKERMINTRIWNDNWFSQLDPIEKLLFLYFLSNSYTNISGVYEMPLKIAAVETGIDPTMLDKILPRLHPKVVVQDGWVVLPKFTKYQNIKSSDVVKGILREFELVPEKVRKLAIHTGWGEGLGTVGGLSGDTKPNLTKPNSISGSREFEIISEDKPVEKKKRVDSDVLAVFAAFSLKYPKNWEANTTQRGAAKRLLEERGMEQILKAIVFYRENKELPFCPVVDTPYKLDSKWNDLGEFKKRNSL